MLPTLKAETLAALPMSNTVRMTTAKVDQGGNKSNNICKLPSRISKNSDKISQKINPQKSSKDFDVQNSEKMAYRPAKVHMSSKNPTALDLG